MANGRKPVLTGVIQSADGSKKVIGRIALWEFEGKKKTGEGGNPFPANQEASEMTARKIGKLYANVDSIGKNGNRQIHVILKDNLGRTIEDYKESAGKISKNELDYKSVVKTLELSAKYCRNKVYIFTQNRLLVNQFYGSYRIRNKQLFKHLMEMKLLCGFFRCVRMFHVKREVSV